MLDLGAMMGIDGSCKNKENIALDSVSCTQPESIFTNSCLTEILKKKIKIKTTLKYQFFLFALNILMCRQQYLDHFDTVGN